jgi:tetratricopeptide (TPR) repeat protein
MAAQLAHACRMRDVRVLNRWLSGQGLPRLSQEGELPHELLWQLIYEWWQPNPPELEACQQLVCDALDACLQTVNGLSLGQLDGTTGFSSSGMGEEHFGQPAINDVLWPTYCRSLFGLCALLPQHVGLFDRLVALDDTKALGHEALAQLAVGQSLQQALVEQQVDDRLVTRRWKGDFDLAMGQIGANRWQEPAATVLASWRAMVLAFADGGATDQVRKPALLAALNRVSQLAEQWPQRAESVDQLLAHMLAQWPATQAGQALVWRAALLAAPLPERVHAVTKDLWPHSGAVDGWLLAEPNLATGWRKLGRVGREAVRQCANEGDAERLAAIQFSLLQAGKPRPWVSELVGALRQHVPALRTDGPDVKAFKQLKVADDEAITEELPTEAVLSSGPRSNYDRFLATTQSIADVTRLLARQKFDVAIRRARELLGRQAADRTPQELQSKTAANLATAFAEVGRYSNAKDLWRSAINLNSFDPVARCGLAEVLKELGDLGGAKVQYQETMRSHPQDVVARNGLADVLKELGDLEGAKVQYQETMRSHPQNVVARNGLADVLKELGDLEGAKAQYQETMRSHPQDVVARCGLAEVLKELGDLEGAKVQYQETMRSHPQDVVARCGLAEVLKELGDLEGAKAQYQETMRSHPQNVVARCGLAEVLKELGDLEGAKVQYQETMRSHPQNVVARCGLAEVLKELGDLGGAKVQYQETMRSHPQDVVARNGLADVLKNWGTGRGESPVPGDHAQPPAKCGGPKWLGRRAQRTGGLGQGRKPSTRRPCAATRKMWWPAAAWLKCSKNWGTWKGAKVQYQETMRSHPQNVVARCGLAEVLKELGDLEGRKSSTRRPCAATRKMWWPEMAWPTCSKNWGTWKGRKSSTRRPCAATRKMWWPEMAWPTCCVV